MQSYSSQFCLRNTLFNVGRLRAVVRPVLANNGDTAPAPPLFAAKLMCRRLMHRRACSVHPREVVLAQNQLRGGANRGLNLALARLNFYWDLPCFTIVLLEKISRRINMNNLDHLLQRNKEFAVQQSAAGTLMPSLLKAMPDVKAIIISCADMRADPAHVLGIKPGEAVVLRNIGGRFTPATLEELALLERIGAVAGAIPGGGGEFHLIVMQHTDCGMTRLAGDPALLAHYFQIQEGELKAKVVTDPRAAVAVDVAALRAIPALPGAWLISGLVYDVATGLVQVVVPPAPIRVA
jgi:carbonic anhydrase